MTQTYCFVGGGFMTAFFGSLFFFFNFHCGIQREQTGGREKFCHVESRQQKCKLQLLFALAWFDFRYSLYNYKTVVAAAVIVVVNVMSFNQITKPFNLFRFALKKETAQRQLLGVVIRAAALLSLLLLFGRDIKLHLVRSCRILHLDPTSTVTFFR